MKNIGRYSFGRFVLFFNCFRQIVFLQISADKTGFLSCFRLQNPNRGSVVFLHTKHKTNLFLIISNISTVEYKFLLFLQIENRQMREKDEGNYSESI